MMKGFTIKKDGNIFVSHCSFLDLFSQGDTREEAEKNIKELTGIFIDDCHERGTLYQVLKDCIALEDE